MAEKEVFNLTKFDGTNFALWKYGVSFMLESQDLMEFIEGTDKQPDKETKLKEWKEWKKRQSKTSVILLSSVDQSLHINLVNCTTPKTIWHKLHLLYGDMTEDAKQRCWQQFYEFRINDGESVATQLEKFETICRKLVDAAETVPDAAIMSKLLSSLPSRYSAFRMAWEWTAKAEQKKKNLIARIIREDKRMTAAEDEASSLALQVKSLQVKLGINRKLCCVRGGDTIFLGRLQG
ncbi:copia [Lasius niger]|uniref:Copia n=1 Tax=Lasius niger TaxID=67767 RepID=A0A0J7K8M0_LASNI|nr:copia [Lasius niger]